MSETTLDSTVGQLAAQNPSALPVFERLGIDYCCGGDQSLDDACKKRGLDPQQVLAEIGRCPQDNGNTTDWLAAPLSELCDHIKQTHHAFLREQLPFLTQLIDKVVDAHAERHPELNDVRETFRALRDELEPHMLKEERILFPAVRALEISTQPVSLPFGTVKNPIGVMEDEHEHAGQALRRLRELTGDFSPPDDACNAYRGLLESLQRLEADLHEHIHMENNILFPRAAELERTRL